MLTVMPFQPPNVSVGVAAFAGAAFLFLPSQTREKPDNNSGMINGDLAINAPLAGAGGGGVLVLVVVLVLVLEKQHRAPRLNKVEDEDDDEDEDEDEDATSTKRLTSTSTRRRATHRCV